MKRSTKRAKAQGVNLPPLTHAHDESGGPVSYVPVTYKTPRSQRQESTLAKQRKLIAALRTQVVAAQQALTLVQAKYDTWYAELLEALRAVNFSMRTLTERLHDAGTCRYPKCTNAARYVNEHGLLCCGICPIKEQHDSIKLASVPALLAWCRQHESDMPHAVALTLRDIIQRKV